MSPFFLFLDTFSDLIFNFFNPYSIAFEAPPVPRIRAFLQFEFKYGFKDSIKPIKSVL